jgi:hypothetical protein
VGNGKQQIKVARRDADTSSRRGVAFVGGRNDSCVVIAVQSAGRTKSYLAVGAKDQQPVKA